jgi:formylglycine-generating enzyme required for sulfatase activity
MPLEPEIVVIPAGPVLQGVPEFPSDAKLPHRWPRREVFVPAFGIARYAVTAGEYLTFAEATGYAISEELRTDPRFQEPRAPVAYTSWIDATRYVQWLSRETGKPYRLVRDAEYEKAARGGLESKRFPWGNEAPTGRADWNNGAGSPQLVGSFAPNGYGLHDMVGSMWSWCEECFDEVVRTDTDDQARMCYDDTLIKDVRLNPICRGGSFKTPEEHVLYCAYRHEDPIDGRFDCIGFRVALSVG